MKDVNMATSEGEGLHVLETGSTIHAKPSSVLHRCNIIRDIYIRDMQYIRDKKGANLNWLID